MVVVVVDKRQGSPGRVTETPSRWWWRRLSRGRESHGQPPTSHNDSLVVVVVDKRRGGPGRATNESQ